MLAKYPREQSLLVDAVLFGKAGELAFLDTSPPVLCDSFEKIGRSSRACAMKLFEPLSYIKRRENSSHTFFKCALYQRELDRSYLAKQIISQISRWRVIAPTKYRSVGPS